MKIERVRSTDDAVELSFSSESPVVIDGTPEVLVHDSQAADLRRLNAGASLLWNHDENQVIGVVESAWIDVKTRKGYARVRPGTSKFAKEVWRDVKAKVRRLASFSYIIKDAIEKGGTRIVRSWEALEVSLVSIPADFSVGIGRSHSNSNSRTSKMSTKDSEKELREARREAEIRKMGSMLQERGYSASEDSIQKAIRDNIDSNEFCRRAMEATPDSTRGADTRVLDDLQRHEKRTFSLARLIRTVAENKPLDGFEAEACREAEKRAGRSARGVMLPTAALSVSELRGRRDFMAAGDYGKGGSSVPVEVGQPISKLDPIPVVERAGATMLRGLSGSLSLPRQTGATDAHWIAEGADIPASTMATDDVLLTPHGVAAFVPVSKQLTSQSSVDIESWLRAELQRRVNLAIDKAALVGSGTGGVPKGIFSLNTATSGVHTVTFGGSPTHAKVVEFETDVEDADGLAGSLNYITSGAVAGAWKTTAVDSGSGRFILENANANANGYPVLRTSQLTSGDHANKVVFGNWSDCIISMWGGFDLTVDPYTLATSGKIRLVLLAHVDVAFRHAESFCVSTDAGNQ